MSGDYSRQTFRKKQHYSGVLEQQGRVQTDADWNEQLEIQLYRTHTEATDVIGRSGVPKKNNGFEITAAGGHDLAIGAGRIYVEGLLCELEDGKATYANQPYLTNPDFTGLASPPSSPPGARQLNLPAGNYVAYLDAWQREITALDDKLIREVALGGPDTTTRLQTVWQVKLLKVGETSPPSSPPASCKTPFADFDKLTAPANGKLNARTQPVAPGDNPCLLPPTAGYNRLENQLYRVEIHTGGPLNQATFKWSRDNGSVETSIKIAGNVLTVADKGKDEVLGFAAGQWVEIVDDEATLKSAPHPLAQIDKMGPGPNEITLKTNVDSFKNGKGLKLRRWDQSTGATDTGISVTLGPPSSPPNGPSSVWIDLEGGVQVQFSCDSLGDTNFRAGDYWLIPARTVTGEIEWPPYEIPNLNPIAQAPRGIAHHFARLALVTSDGATITKIEDCRKKFPSLTTICAEDICFENDKCDFAGAETVQDALDRLCSANDLRFHNKHLHGWGIVCGLQVYCCTDDEGESCKDDAGRPGRFVTINGGYAIDCEGNDIQIKDEHNVDVLSMIGPQTSPSTDGEWCLILDPKGGTKDLPFRIEPYKPPKKNWQSILAGTILADVLQDCIQSLIDFVKEEFTVQPGEDKTPVGPTQKRITTFGNLLIQLINKQNGSFVFLSGDKGKSDPNFEDTILRNFYTKLREKLQSHTFCAMFDNARPFPDYPYSGTKIATIFGKGYQKRLRIAPGGKLAYSVGAGKTINVYDLEKGEMIDELEFPGGTSSIVQDVAFSKDGKQLYAVATLQNKDSAFAIADVSGVTHKWGKPTVICDVLLLSLGTLSSLPFVFAAGKDKGLYKIDPTNINATPQPLHPFHAVGQLVISEELGAAFATANKNTAGTVYDQVVRFDLKTDNAAQVTYNLSFNAVPLSGQDDIAISSDTSKLYVVVDPIAGTSTKALVTFKTNIAPQPPSALSDLGENTGIRLANNPTTKRMMVTYEDSYRVGVLDEKDQLIQTFRHPVQISPTSIAMSPDNKRVYVLNYASNTVNSIPAEFLDPKNQLPLQPLVDYRAGVLNAFADLLGGLIQYLKDCFCDHFLVNCPECDEDDKLYLACITIKNGKVFKVCNFSLRKYVHSFPTVEYWVSVIPIIPIIKAAVEKFCCAALPGFFSKFQAPQPKVDPAAAPGPAKNTLKSEHMEKGITYAQQSDFRGGFSRTITAAAPAAKLLTDAAKNTANRSLVPEPGAIQHAEVVNKSTGDVAKTLEGANVTVDKVEPYDPNKAGHNLIKFAGAPPQLRPGMRVNLVTENDKVLFYTLADEPSTPAELRDQIDATRTTVEENRKALDQALPALDNLRTELANNKDAVSENQAALQKLSPQLDELRTRLEADSFANKAVFDKISPQLADMQKKIDAGAAIAAANKATIDQTLPRLETLSAAIDANRLALEKSTPQLADLRTRVDAAAAAAAEAKTASTGTAAFQEQVNSLRAELLKQQQVNKEALDARDKAITQLQTDLRTSIGGINERIKKLPNL